MRRNWYEQRQHRSHVSGRRVSKCRFYGDMCANSLKAIIRRIKVAR